MGDVKGKNYFPLLHRLWAILKLYGSFEINQNCSDYLSFVNKNC